MSKRNWYLLGGVLVLMFLVIIFGIVVYLFTRVPADSNTTNTINSQTNQTNTTVPNNGASVNTTNPPSATPDTSILNNDYMKFTYPNSWTVNAASPSAINVTKGNYILYINTQASQASGVTGGRFNEISSGAPGSDLVIKTYPSGPCGSVVNSDSFSGFESQKRVDLYIDSTEPSENCNLPTNGKNVWYFSYVTTTADGYYFNYYTADQPKAYVITMTYNTNNINNLPVKGSAELDQALDEMTTIVRSLEIKVQ